MKQIINTRHQACDGCGDMMWPNDMIFETDDGLLMCNQCRLDEERMERK